MATMDVMQEPPSEITKFFEGRNVFITGATGFLGKMTVEKLLRACPNVGKIYILIREKKGKNIQERLDQLLNSSVFECLKSVQPKFYEGKIGLVKGDCIEPNLGLSETDRKMLINEIDCVIHCAATVRFDEKIRKVTYINLRATMDMLALAKEMKKLRSFIYVSTAFSNCIRKDIKEEFYEPLITKDKLMMLLEVMDDDMLDKITPMLLGDCPNTYIFTKSVAEDFIKNEAKGLPIAIIRPSIITSSCKEPIPGWIDNYLGATGMFVGAALGVIHSLPCNINYIADLIPADFIVNCIIAAAWNIGSNRNYYVNSENAVSPTKKGQEIPIYNCVSSAQNPITWKMIMNKGYKYAMAMPSVLQVWYYFVIINSNYGVHRFCSFLFHFLPAYIIDFFVWCAGRKPMFVKIYEKIDRGIDVISYFGRNEWYFKNGNTQALFKKLNKEDKILFNFDANNLDWDQFLENGTKGGRVYLLKDPLDTVPQAKRKYLKLTVAHYVIVSLFMFGVYRLFNMLWSAIF